MSTIDELGEPAGYRRAAARRQGGSRRSLRRRDRRPFALADRDSGHVMALSHAADGAGSWALVFEDRASFADTHDPFAAYPVSLMQHLAPSLPDRSGDRATGDSRPLRRVGPGCRSRRGRRPGGNRRTSRRQQTLTNGFPVEVQQAARYLLDNTGSVQRARDRSRRSQPALRRRILDRGHRCPARAERPPAGAHGELRRDRHRPRGWRCRR